MDRETEPLVKFSFPERKTKESPQDYWRRAIRENLNKGVPHDIVANVIGEIMGGKEEREGIDDLTELKKKRIFWEDLREILGYIRRQAHEGTPEKASLILLDLDDFKKENDSRGYRWGDKILKRVAKVLQVNKRAEDVAARWGGEEFCLVLVNCPEPEAFRISEKLRESIEQLGITASFGIAESRDREESPEDFFDRANVACAIAKGTLKHELVEGSPKNRVVIWQPKMPAKLEREKDRNG